MTRRYTAFILTLVLFSILFGFCGYANEKGGTTGEGSAPYYFIAIHNEPFYRDGGDVLMSESYEVLKRMVERANRYNIRLTLMFSPQWVDFLMADHQRFEEFKKWKSQGHEIAAHHHSIYHGNWDGYTNYPEETAISERKKRTRKPEKYIGTLSDYIEKLRLLNPSLKSGCLNDEHDKNCLPNEIAYDTGSGLANSGEPGTLLNDAVPTKGKNEYVTTGILRGIEHKWLCHFQTTTVARQLEAQKVFDSMSSGVYGSVNHSGPHEEEAFNAWIDYLHSKDPEGKRSRTLSGVIVEGILQEKSVSEEALTRKQERNPRGAPDRELIGLVEKMKKLIEEKQAEGADVSRVIELDRKSKEAFHEGRIDECRKLLQEAIQELSR